MRSRVEIPPAGMRGFFELCVRQCTRISDWLRAVKCQSNVNRYLLTIPWENVCVLRADGKIEGRQRESYILTKCPGSESRKIF